MSKYLIKSLQIDINYTVNSFIYTLRGLPILKDLITDDIYASKIIKKIIYVIILLFFLARAIFLKFFYFFVIFVTCYELFPDTLVKTYFHVYFILTILGMFINNKLLNTSKKKYFSIFLFKMEANKYAKSNLIWNLFSNLILNSICIFIFGFIIKSSVRYSLMLIVFSLFIRLIGEALNIVFYKKYNYIWYSNTRVYSIVLSVSILLLLLPYINIYIPLNIMFIITFITIILGLISLRYLLKLEDYKLIYKKIFSVVDVMNSKNDKDYFRQAMVAVKDKDKVIDKDKLIGKKGYDLFNTIFFERHREILIRSAKKYSIILIGIYIVVSYLVITDKEFTKMTSNFLLNNLGWFVIIMYFVNRGAIITQAMFFNCDHAMLRYNFYRNKDTLLGLFKKRLLTISKVNLLPSGVIAIGNTILLILCHNTNYIVLITSFLFIIFLSIFFSVHYLVIYYLLQPFNKEMEVKKISYSIVTLITYMISYSLTDLSMNSLLFSGLGLIITIIYIGLSLLLVYRYAPKTFKLF